MWEGAQPSSAAVAGKEAVTRRAPSLRGVLAGSLVGFVFGSQGPCCAHWTTKGTGGAAGIRTSLVTLLMPGGHHTLRSLE